MSWRDRAACKGIPTGWFYHEGSTPNPKAINTCKGCPVRSECLETALQEERYARHTSVGFRGGLTANQRRNLITQRLKSGEPWPDPERERHDATVAWLEDWRRNQPQPPGAQRDPHWTTLAARIRSMGEPAE